MFLLIDSSGFGGSAVSKVQPPGYLVKRSYGLGFGVLGFLLPTPYFQQPPLMYGHPVLEGKSLYRETSAGLARAGRGFGVQRLKA